MAKTEIIDNEYMGLWFHPVSKIVHHKIKETLPKGEFQRLLSTGAEWMEKHGATKWLSDDTNLVVLQEEEYKWGDAEWAPRVIKAGFKYWAVVLPSGAIGSMQLKRLIKEYRDRGVTVEGFDSLEAAIAWLESK